MKDLQSIRSSDLKGTIKCQYEEQDRSLYYNIEYSTTNSEKEIEAFFELVLGMNERQKQFFIEPIFLENNAAEKMFVYYPGNDISSLYFFNGINEINDFKPGKKDKLLLMKWIFSFICGIKVLFNNNFTKIKIFDKSIFIDSLMEARLFYVKYQNEKDKISIIPISEYFLPHEEINICMNENKNSSTENHIIIDDEKKSVYSIGVFMLSLLTRKLPDSYFENKSRNKIFEQINNGIFLKKIPECPWKNIINKCLSKDPTKRPAINDLIELFLKKENCLDDNIFNEFFEWIRFKFNLNEKNQDEIFKAITAILGEEIQPKTNDIPLNQFFRISDLSKFTKLARGTCFEDRLTENCEEMLEELYNNVLCDQMKKLYSSNKTKVPDKYKFMSLLTEHNSDGNLDFWHRGCIKLFSVDNMDDNQSFFLRVYKQTHSIRFELPTEIEFPQNYIEKLNDNRLFVHVYINDQNELKNEISLYPFLNVHNIIFNFSLSQKLHAKQKIKWLYQTAAALQVLHKEGFTISDFNDQKVFIDMDLNAYLFPSNVIQIDSKKEKEFDFSDDFNNINFFYPPELISGDFNRSEKMLSYSFGVFMLELLYDVFPGIQMKNLSASDKQKILLKKRKLFQKNYGELDNLIIECLNFDQIERPLFKDISEKIQSYWNGNFDPNELDDSKSGNFDLKFEDLQKVEFNGGTISNRIFDFMYQKMDKDQRFNFNFYNQYNLSEISKFELIWAVINNDEISKKIQNPTQKEKELKIFSQNLDEFSCKSYTEPFLDTLDKTMNKVHNKTSQSFCHLGGLELRTARQLTIRTSFNLNRDNKNKLDFVVKNEHNLPYGYDLKMKKLESILNDINKAGIFGGDAILNKSSCGNAHIVFPVQKNDMY
ncbi:hypothetical protein M9Y10_003668 [Tritrichomonas musculus]|uniref:Protein kinase domain-containing protein n=1 Tax=Tritrichomonas musculus TaxID=1915356 RepID=A0ABR2JQG7_9EUKA